MATQYTSLLGLALPVQGELSGTWGDTVNDAITSLLDTAVAGTTTLSTDGDVTLTTTTGASNQARQAILLCSGARTALRTITAPAQSKIYTIINATTGGFSVKIVGVGPTTGVTIVAGESAVVAWNGSDFIKISNTGGSGSFTNVTISGTTTLSGLTASTALALNSSKEVVSVTNTGTGNNVLSASPTLTGTVGGASMTLSSLTSGRVTYAGASGLLQDSANLLYSGTDLTVYGITVGRGAGAVSTNTAVGASALGNGSQSGTGQTAIGNQVLKDNTSGVENTGLGYAALFLNTTGNRNTALGTYALIAGTTGSDNVAVGHASLNSQTTGANNVAVGKDSLRNNTTAANNTAVGHQAGYSNTTGNTASLLGGEAGFNVTTAAGSVAVGYRAGKGITTGNYNTFVGAFAGDGSGGNLTGAGNTAVGPSAGASLTTGTYNSFFGPAGQIDQGPGGQITTGSKNTILGGYNGNQGGLDIRTANNYIVLSDGDGNPRLIGDSNGNFGVNVPPSGWGSGYKVLDFPNTGAAFGGPSFGEDNGSPIVSCNTYNDGGAWRYKTTGQAVSLYNSRQGRFTWAAAVSGTAGNAITFTPVMEIELNKSLALGSASAQSGTGITFPASQFASSNANTLDDYEEGSWTPGLSGSFTYTSRSGKYTKIGNTVTVSGDIIWASNSSGSTSWAVTGLPFTVSDNRVPATLGYMAGVDNIGGKQIIATTSSGQTSFDFWAINDNATPTNIDAANISSTGEVQFCIVYHTST